MKKTVVLMCIIALLIPALYLSCGQAGPNTPEATAKGFFEAFVAGDLEKANSYGSESTNQILNMLEGIAKMDGGSFKDMMEDEYKGDKPQVKVISSAIDGDKGVVTLEIDGERDDISVIREDGKWKVNLDKEGFM